MNDLAATEFETDIARSSTSKVRVFMAELAEDVPNHRSLFNLTEQVEHQYHGRFLIELLQNGHDALLRPGEPGRVQGRLEIRLVTDEDEFGVLYVANDGRPFSKSNFRSLAQLGQSDKSPEDSIGNKGIGFRSVLEVTDSPEVYSRSHAGRPKFDGYCFGFSPKVIGRVEAPLRRLLAGSNAEPSPFDSRLPLVENGSELLAKFRAAAGNADRGIIARELRYLSPYFLPFPLPREGRSEYVAEFAQRGFATVIRLPLKSSSAQALARASIEQLDSSTLLFLDRATHMTLAIGAETREIKRSSNLLPDSLHNGHLVAIQDGSGEPRRYRMWSDTVPTTDMSSALHGAIAALGGRWNELTEVTVTIGVRVGSRPEKGVVSIFLPTTVATGCAAHINAAFFGDMSRTNIRFDTEYNKQLLQIAARLTIAVIKDELAGRDDLSASAIVDLLAPWGDEPKAYALWIGILIEAAKGVSLPLDHWPVIKTDKGWEAMGVASSLPVLSEASVMTPALLRTHASFPALVSSLDSRGGMVSRLYEEFDLDVAPNTPNIATTIEVIAGALHGSGSLVDWNGFWTDTVKLLKDNASPLIGKKVLLGTDGRLHASDDSCAVFFIPRQGSHDDEEMANIGPLQVVPPLLQHRIAFLSEDVSVYDPQNARIQTPIRRFLDTKLVRRFRVEDILAGALIPQTPSLPAPLAGPRGELCSAIMNWALRLVTNLAERGRAETALKLMKDIPVPCIAGWYASKDASFGAGWSDTIGPDTTRYLENLGSGDATTALQKLLLPPTHETWGGAGAQFTNLLRVAGVFDGLKTVSVMPNAWTTRFNATRTDFSLPSKPPPGLADAQWQAYRAYARENSSPQYFGSFEYEIQSLVSIPGLDGHAGFDDVMHQLFQLLTLRSMPQWDTSWKRLTIRKTGGSPNQFYLESPLFLTLKTLPWVGSTKAGVESWGPPASRWHVPAGTLAGRAAHFAHLHPLGAADAQLLDANPAIATNLYELGLPKFDTEVPSSSPALLEALASAKQEEVSDWRVLLGQVLNAWSAFYPAAPMRFPSAVYVRQGTKPVHAVVPSLNQIVYVPDGSRASNSALEQFGVPVTAIEITDAKRLAAEFKQAYGDGVRLVSELDVVPVVDGKPWAGEVTTLLQESELEWLIPVMLALFAYFGPQAKGTNATRFRERLATLRTARVGWVSNLKAALIFRNNVVADFEVGAVWIAADEALLVSDVCRDTPGRLGDTLAQILERDDLVLPLKMALREIEIDDPEPDAVIGALALLDISEAQYEEAREHWRGDLGVRIRQIQPLVLVLRPATDVSQLVELDTEEAVRYFLDDLSDPDINGAHVLAMSRAAGTPLELARATYERFGRRADLAYWNDALAKLGQAPLVNPGAAIEFKGHLTSTLGPLRCLVAALVRQGHIKAGFKAVYEQLLALPCPERLAREVWEISFESTMVSVGGTLAKAGATASALAAVMGAKDAATLESGLAGCNIDTRIDPLDLLNENQANLRLTLQRLQDIGLAWAASKGYAQATKWELWAEKAYESISPSLSDGGYLSKYEEPRLLKMIKEFGSDPDATDFWAAVNPEAPVDAIAPTLGLTPEQVASAAVTLVGLREKAAALARIVAVCGEGFDGAEQNFGALWKHICRGVPDDALPGLETIELEKPRLLKQLPKKLKKKRRDPPLKPPSKPTKRLTKTMESLIGLAGEIHAFRILRQKYGATVVQPSCWISRNSNYVYPDNHSNDGFGCDFVVRTKKKEYYVEVKASVGSDESFTLASSEVGLARDLARKKNRNKKEFRILHVTNALSPKPGFRALPNPYDPRFETQFSVEDADTRVRYEISNSAVSAFQLAKPITVDQAI